MTETRHALEAAGLEFSYRAGEPVLGGVDLKAPGARLTAILGPNGSGKTTLCKCLMGWLVPEAGRIVLDGRPLGKYSRKEVARTLAYVPQFPGSAFAFTVRELVLMGRFAHSGFLGLASAKDVEVARAAMEMTGTLGFADRALGELSGGEAQCAMIARALAQEATVMLLDEPTSHLDIRNQLMVHRLMRRLAGEWGMAVVCVSHDVNLAARFADELVLMKEGRAVAAGPPTEIVREDVLGEVYDVKIKLVRVPGQEVPSVVAD